MIITIPEEKMRQGTDDWLKIRSLYLTGTDASRLLKGEKPERILRDKQNATAFTSYATERGHTLEPIAKELYTAVYGEPIEDVGFVINDKYPCCGVSPDGLVGDDGVVEVKCFYAKNQRVKFVGLSPEIIAQTQWEMFVTERKYCQFIMFCPDMDNPKEVLETKRLEPNSSIQEMFRRKMNELLQSARS